MAYMCGVEQPSTNGNKSNEMTGPGGWTLQLHFWQHVPGNPSEASIIVDRTTNGGQGTKAALQWYMGQRDNYGEQRRSGLVARPPLGLSSVALCSRPRCQYGYAMYVVDLPSLVQQPV